MATEPFYRIMITCRAALRALAVSVIALVLFAPIWPTPAAGQDADPPAKPTGLTATATYDSVTLTWDAPDDTSITGYQVLRRDKSVHAVGEFAVLVDDTQSAAPTYTDTSVEEQGRYTYRIKARNPAGLSPRSSYADAKIPEAPPQVFVNFASPTYSPQEGEKVTVELTLDVDPQRTVIVDLTVVNENGASSNDYSGVPSSVTFKSGDTTASFTFTATDDTEYDDGESVSISIDSSLSDRVSLGTQDSTTVTIADNDEAPAPEEPDETEEDSGEETVDADATREGAIDLGDITGLEKTQFPKHDINGEDDLVDYFKFTITEPKRVAVGLRQLGYDADVSLEDSGGKTLKSSRKSGTKNEAITRTLLEGTYYVRVEAKEPGQNEYALAHGVATPNPGKVDDARRQDVTRELVFNPTSVTVTEEDSSGARYRVSLSSRPTNTVTVTLSVPAGSPISLGAGDGTTSISITINASDWETPRSVGVYGNADSDSDDETETITHTATGGGYGGVTKTLDVTVLDDDFRLMSNSSSVFFDEGDGGQTKSVWLSSRPTGDVTVTVTGMEGTDVQVYPTVFTISRANYRSGNTIWLGGVPDRDTDDESVALTFTPSGGGYDNSPPLQITANVDDLGSSPPRGVYVFPQNLTVNEGQSVAYSVALTSRPTGDVTITLADEHYDPDYPEDSKQLFFTRENYADLQEVTYVAKDTHGTSIDDKHYDHVVTGADYGSNDVKAPSVRIDAVDLGYVNVFLDVSTNRVEEGDDSLSAIITSVWHSELAPTRHHAYSLVSESEMKAEQTGIYLSPVPRATSGRDYGPFSIAVVFFPGDYRRDLTDPSRFVATRSIVADIRDDDIYERNESFGIGLQRTPVWSAPNIPQYEASTSGISLRIGFWERILIHDDDPSGITVSSTGLEVTEGDTTGAFYDLEMVSEPAEDVVIDIRGAAGSDLTVSPATVTFTPGNWRTPKRVTITAAEDDDTLDDRVVLTHSPRKGERELYIDGDIENVVITVKDNDKGVNLSPLSLEVQEGGAAGEEYTVWLSVQPSDTVTVAITGTTNTDLTLDNDSLTFTVDNWHIPQTVTVTASNDADGIEDTATLTHTPSGGDYDNIAASTLPVTVRERTAVRVRPTSLRIVEGDSTGASYGVTLEGQPSGDVTITVSRTGSSDIEFDKTTLTFTRQTWNVEQRVKVTGLEDAEDGGKSATLSHSASGGGYGSVAIDDVSVTLVERNDLGIRLDPPALTIGEGNSTAYDVWLSHEPSTAGTVTVTITGMQNTDVTLSDQTLTFTGDNWDMRQTVTVYTAADTDAHDETVTLTHTASGGGYNNVTRDLEVEIRESDSRGITVSPGSLTMMEGDEDTYTVVLDEKPTDNVRVDLRAPLDAGITTKQRFLTFTPRNWNREQTVNVTAMQDDDAGDESDTIRHSSRGGRYEGARSDSVIVTVNDDDTRGVTISESSLDVAEDGGTATYNVVLDTEPTSTVTVTVTSSNTSNATVDKPSLTFTTETWNIEQEVTVTGVDDDDFNDEARTSTITHAVSGGDYAGITAASVSVTLIDDEASLRFTWTSQSVNEGSSIDIVVRLSQALGRTVEVPLHTYSTDGARDWDYKIEQDTVTFGPEDTEQTITFNALVDDHRDPGESVIVTFRNPFPTGLEVREPYEFTVTIVDVQRHREDPIALEMSIDNKSLKESDGSTATSTITITRADGRPFRAGQTVSVNFRGNATPVDDYTITPKEADSSNPIYTDSGFTGSVYQVTASQATDTVELTLSLKDDSDADPCESVVASAMLTKGGVEVIPQLLLTIVDNDNSTDTADLSVGLNNERIGELTAADNGKDWYSFEATADTKYIIEVKQPLVYLGLDKPAANGEPKKVPGCLEDPSILQIIDKDYNQVLGENDGGGFTGHFARAFFTPSDAGTYWIAVGAGAQDREGLGCYTISVRADDHPDDYRAKPGVALEPGNSITASIDSDVSPGSADLNTWDWVKGNGKPTPRQGVESMDDRDVIRVNISEAGTYRFAFTNRPTGVGIWTLWDKRGSHVFQTDDSPVASLTVSLEKGHYYVEIGTPYSSNGNTGSYTVSLSRSN